MAKVQFSMAKNTAKRISLVPKLQLGNQLGSEP